MAGDVAGATGVGVVAPGAADVADTNTGVGPVTANVANISSAGTPTAVPLSACASNCTVNGVTYSYVSAQQTAKNLTNGANLGFSVTATDNANNTATDNGGMVTVDNTNPTVPALLIALSLMVGLWRQAGEEADAEREQA